MRSTVPALRKWEGRARPQVRGKKSGGERVAGRVKLWGPFRSEQPDYPRRDLAAESVLSHSIKPSPFPHPPTDVSSCGQWTKGGRGHGVIARDPLALLGQALFVTSGGYPRNRISIIVSILLAYNGYYVARYVGVWTNVFAVFPIVNKKLSGIDGRKLSTEVCFGWKKSDVGRMLMRG